MPSLALVDTEYPTTEAALRYLEAMQVALRELKDADPPRDDGDRVARACAIAESFENRGLELDRTGFAELLNILHELQDEFDHSWDYPGLEPLTAARSYADAVATWLSNHPRPATD